MQSAITFRSSSQEPASAAHQLRNAVALQDNRAHAGVFQRQAAEEETANTTVVREPVVQRMPQGTRKSYKRAAKKVARKVYGMRDDPARLERRLKNEKDLEFARKLKVKRAEKFRAFKKALKATISQYTGYPQGSYAHGRYLYLTGKLQALGRLDKGQAMLDFDRANVEIDHSPHDASQRTGPRVNDEASKHRVAVPLPRGWHRRHKTTHDAGATRHDAGFSASQATLVSTGNYATALQNHLLDTFSNEAIGSTGWKKVQVVIDHTMHALNYANSNIPVKIHPGHTANQPAIDNAELATIRAALQARINALIALPNYSSLTNPF